MTVREVPRCGAPALQGRAGDACGARSRYVVVLASGPVFSCGRHLSVAVDARVAESAAEGSGGGALVWSAHRWRYADSVS